MKRILSLFMALCLLFCMTLPAMAAESAVPIGTADGSEYFARMRITAKGTDGTPIEGAVYRLYQMDDTFVLEVTTDQSGTALSDEFPIGPMYYLEGIFVPNGWEPYPERMNINPPNFCAPVTMEFTITHSRASLSNPDKFGQIQLLKKDVENDKLLSGAVFSVFSAADVEVCKLTTGEDGTSTTADLPVGDYYLVEQTAPDGYEKSNDKHPVTVPADTAAKVVVYNKTVPPVPAPKPTTGTVKVWKVDAEDNTPLSNAVFSVYDKGGKKVGELLTGKDGTAMLKLPAGDYSIRETQAPEGYRPSGDTISFSLKAGETRELTVKNSKADTPVTPEPPAKSATLKIIKVDGDSGKKLAGAVFGVYNADTDRQIDTLTTDKNGVATLSLPAGDYYIREQEAPKGYILKKTDINFHLEPGATRELTVKNAREDDPEEMGILEITKEDKDMGKTLRNAVFAVYDRDNEKIDELTTGRDGMAELELPVGSYYLREVDAPKGYQLDCKKVSFKIIADKTTRITVENEKEVTEPVGTMELVKSAAGSGKRLSGAVFGVYENTGDKKLFEVTTDGNGLATLELPVGSYSLKELRAPSGYRVETARILFDVRKDGKTVVEVTNELEGAPTMPEQPTLPERPAVPGQPSTPTTPTAPDQPVISIPQTGEPFPTFYYAMAALLLTVAAVCTAGAVRQRRPEKQ